MQYNVEDTVCFHALVKSLVSGNKLNRRSGSIFNMAVNANTCTIGKRFKCDTCGFYAIYTYCSMTASILVRNHTNVIPVMHNSHKVVN